MIFMFQYTWSVSAVICSPKADGPDSQVPAHPLALQTLPGSDTPVSESWHPRAPESPN